MCSPDRGDPVSAHAVSAIVEKNQQMSRGAAICTKSKFVNQHRFLRLSEKNLFVHRILLSSTQSSGEIADFDRGDDGEEASVVVLNVGRFGNDLQTGLSALWYFQQRPSACLCADGG